LLAITLKEKTIKVAKWGTPKKIFKKNTQQRVKDVKQDATKNVVYTKGPTSSNIISFVDIRKKSVNGLCETIAIQNKKKKI
jgi:hypothetical protein